MTVSLDSLCTRRVLNGIGIRTHDDHSTSPRQSEVHCNRDRMKDIWYNHVYVKKISKLYRKGYVNNDEHVQLALGHEEISNGIFSVLFLISISSLSFTAVEAQSPHVGVALNSYLRFCSCHLTAFQNYRDHLQQPSVASKRDVFRVQKKFSYTVPLATATPLGDPFSTSRRNHRAMEGRKHFPAMGLGTENTIKAGHEEEEKTCLLASVRQKTKKKEH
ncbi:hypothetical protein TNCV_4141671 [Trichonephila clavipes]|nr:hypothetical protein TNCV_4141671 [Trichonephila clavipes]